MKIFDHFWIDLTSANEDNGEKPWLSELNVKDAKKDKKIHIKNRRMGSSIEAFLQEVRPLLLFVPESFAQEKNRFEAWIFSPVSSLALGKNEPHRPR